jgi:pyruvate,water dikinase
MASSDFIGWFADIGLEDRPQVGGKGGSLGELQRAGIAVPPGFVVKTRAFEEFIAVLETREPLRALVQTLPGGDLAAVRECSARIRRRIEEEPLPAGVMQAVSAAHTALCAGVPTPVAVRSSATTEDAIDASFAGLQDTYLWVTNLHDTLLRLRTCWSSLYSVESMVYRRERGLPEQGVAMAVVVQTMVNARSAGVMFTRSPVTGDRSVVTIEAAWGLGSAVVGGEVTPDRWVLGKITGEVSVREISEKQIQHVPLPGGGTDSVSVPEELRRTPCMSDAELQALRTIARKIERHYGRPQDIEWAVAQPSDEILMLQSRPETVWSSKEAAPVARPTENPLSHVMSVFGGKR